MKWFFVIILSLSLAVAFPRSVRADESLTLWNFQSIDTVKYSRDLARDQDTFLRIPEYVDKVAGLHPTHIAISTPYDEEFIPVLTEWVKAARKHNLKVWFRGNFSGWEGWFEYLPLDTPQKHHLLTAQFIKNHPDLFSDGDIFTPAPEPENGILGDPRQSQDGGETYRQFLIDSYRNCNQGFTLIGKKVTCGYFSTNLDIVKAIYNPELIANTGNVIALDHYVKTPNQFALDIDDIYKRYRVPIVIGEFGAPIPDLQGEMSQSQQADFVGELLNRLWHRQDYIKGINYWSFAAGSTAIFNSDLSPRTVSSTISRYYTPGKIEGEMSDPLYQKLQGVTVKNDSNSILAHSTNSGSYSITLPEGTYTLEVNKPGYVKQDVNFTIKRGQVQVADIILDPSVKTLGYKIRYLWQQSLIWIEAQLSNLFHY